MLANRRRTSTLQRCIACSARLSNLLNACRVLQNENGTASATYTFGDAYAASIKPIIINGTHTARPACAPCMELH